MAFVFWGTVTPRTTFNCRVWLTMWLTLPTTNWSRSGGAKRVMLRSPEYAAPAKTECTRCMANRVWTAPMVATARPWHEATMGCRGGWVNHARCPGTGCTRHPKQRRATVAPRDGWTTKAPATLRRCWCPKVGSVSTAIGPRFKCTCVWPTSYFTAAHAVNRRAPGTTACPKWLWGPITRTPKSILNATWGTAMWSAAIVCWGITRPSPTSARNVWTQRGKKYKPKCFTVV